MNIQIRSLLLAAGCALMLAPARCQDYSSARPIGPATSSSSAFAQPSPAAAPTGQADKLPAGSGAAEVQAARKAQEESTAGLKDKTQPLTSIVNVNADMVIGKNEVLLGPLRGLLVQVKNNTDRPLIFDGNGAVANVSGAKLKAAPLIQIENIAAPIPTFQQKLKAAAVDTIVQGGTIGAEVTGEDMIRQNGPIPPRYGKDETRRDDEVSRFGKRIVWPGDSTEGVMYFESTTPLATATIEIPVNSLYDKSDTATIRNK